MQIQEQKRQTHVCIFTHRLKGRKCNFLSLSKNSTPVETGVATILPFSLTKGIHSLQLRLVNGGCSTEFGMECHMSVHGTVCAKVWF